MNKWELGNILWFHHGEFHYIDLLYHKDFAKFATIFRVLSNFVSFISFYSFTIFFKAIILSGRCLLSHGTLKFIFIDFRIQFGMDGYDTRYDRSV